MARLFAAHLQNAIKPLGLAPAQFMTLLELWAENGLTQKQLVDRLDVEQATMANTIRRMERDGLILRKPHPEDRRAQIICLTDLAVSLEVKSKKMAGQVNAKALENLTDPKAFLSQMTQVIANLQNKQAR